MRIAGAVLGAALLASGAAAQGLPNIPGLGNAIPGLSRPQTAEEKRAFCGRAARAAASCLAAGGLSLDIVGLSTCLVKTLPPQDALQVAQVAQRAGGSAGALLGECGIEIGR